MIMIDAQDPAPLYAQVEHQLATEIAAGRWAVHEQLPTEDQLIDMFGVSRITIRRAIQNLVTRGVVEVRRGRGTFVATPRITQELTELSGFVEDMQVLGKHPTAQVLTIEKVIANADVAKALDLGADAKVVRILRVRLADGVPISLDETFLPEVIGTKIVNHDLETEPIFGLLEQRYDLPLIEADYEMEATIASPDISSPLQIAPGSAIFLIKRTSYTNGRVPIDFERLHYRGDAIRFATRLLRRTDPSVSRASH